MRALAWDDKPDDYMQDLRRHFGTFGIDLQIEADVGKFLEAYRSGGWQFVVTDLYLEISPAQGDLDPSHGVAVARNLSRDLAVYVVTGEYERMTREQLGFPPGVVIKSKSTHPAWMAGEIVDDLKRRGLFYDPRRVFLIYGHDRGWTGLREKVRLFLKDDELEVIEISGVNLHTEILAGLLEKMTDCAAFIALCTPDDRIDGTPARYQPRQNVLMEIGMVLGLSRGLQRLTILQGWRPDPQHQAQLPSDLAGVVTIRMEGEFEHYHKQLRDRLIGLGVQMRGGG